MVASARLAFVIIYINDLPHYAPLFFRSVELNPCIDVLLVVDRPPAINLPSNVIVKVISREDLLHRICTVTGLSIDSMTGHKLCDFRPLFPVIFRHELQDYEWWGHCDLDMMFGSLGPWIDSYLSQQYDVFTASDSGTVGHFTIYRNTEEVCLQMFSMLNSPGLRKLFIHPDNQHLDEGEAYEHIISGTSLRLLTTPQLSECLRMKFAPYGITFNPDGSIADLKVKEFGVAYWQDGRTWYETRGRLPVEVLYIHFMGTKMWWNWFFYHPNRASRAKHVFSPIGYGFISRCRDMELPSYRLIRFMQILPHGFKVITGALLRAILPLNSFRQVRKLILRSGRYS
jgi:hypothetical protein